MDKIRLGKTGMMVSRVGFGGIPIQRNSEEDAVTVVSKCLDMGINFVDTAPGYTNSEERIGKALSGHHNLPFISTKSYSDKEEINARLKHSLKMLDVNAIDLYQLHNVSDFNTLKKDLAPGGALSVLQEAKKAGLIKHIGISSHQIDVAKVAVKSGQFETIQFYLNFITDEAADELIPLARQYDVGFIAMKPFAGGRIKNGSLAIKYLLQFPDIMIMAGIGKISEAEEIIRVMNAPKLNHAERQEIERIRQEKSMRVCRHCDYCQPCPQGINISYVVGDFEPMLNCFPTEYVYSTLMPNAIKVAAKCDNCGKCEKKCPYNVPIREMLAEYVMMFNEGKMSG
jgi:predicted aldo/keto reductase-like oxidoreductase